MRKKLSIKYLEIVALILAALILTITTTASAADSPQVETAVISSDVVDREPVNVGTSFQSAVGRLFCYTKIVGAEDLTEIAHVWYYGDIERARVSLSVKASTWRTYSSKLIQSHEIGNWRVEVLDSAGNVMETLQFEIVQ